MRTSHAGLSAGSIDQIDMDMEIRMENDRTHKPGVQKATSTSALLRLASSTPSPLSQRELDVAATDLSYFHSVASKALPQFSTDPMPLRDVLMRMALTDDSPSSQAVLQSMLAFASLHRSDQNPQHYQSRHRQTLRLKSSAIQSLQMAASTGVCSTAQALQHIGAGLLLSSVETCLGQVNLSSSLWVLYLCGSKTIVGATFTPRYVDDEEATVMLRCVIYYDVLARFALRHWRPMMDDEVRIDAQPASGARKVYRCTKTTSELDEFQHLAPAELSLLSDTVEGVARIGHGPLPLQVAQYGTMVDRLEEKIRHVDSQVPAPARSKPRAQNQAHGVSEDLLRDMDESLSRRLFIIATKIYFERLARRLHGSSPRIDCWVEEALGIMTRMHSALKPFPMFIIGSEARGEAQRKALLDIISCLTYPDGVEPVEESRDVHVNLKVANTLLKDIWCQNDLDTDGRLDYDQKLHSVFRRCERLPNFC